MLGFHKEDQIAPEAAHFSSGKVTALGVLCWFAFFVCLTLLTSFFLLSSSLINMHTCNVYYTCNDLVMLVHQLLSGGVGVRATGPVGS